MIKKTFIGAKPTPESADAWVETRSVPPLTAQNAPGEAKSSETANTTSNSSIEAPAGAPAAPAAKKEEMKRLTIDMPESLHTAVMTGCAKRKVKVAQVVRDFLMREFEVEVQEAARAMPLVGNTE